MRRFALAFAFVLALAALPALAAVETYTVDRAHSEVSFQIRHFVTNVRGQFDQYEGTIWFDTENPEASRVEFEIDAASINTFNADRDKHLRSDDFFAVEKHPKISFKSSKIKKTGENAYAVTGTFVLRGVTKEITLPVTFLGTVKDPWGSTRAGFEATAALDRKDYGINWNRALDQGGFVLGDEAKISINLETVLKKPEAAGP